MAAAGLLLGTYAPRLDEKGRLFLPAKFREQFADGLVMTKGQERCLYVWPQDEFGRIAAQLQEAPVTNRTARDYVRIFLAGAAAETPDKQGRVTIPPPLRDYARLERDCTVIGVGARAEIWSTSAWEAYSAAQEESFAQLSEEVLPGQF